MANELTIVVDSKALSKLRKGLEFERGSKRIVTEGVKLVEDEQIKTYTSSSRPAQPAGTTYRRTFKLQRSSRTKVKKGKGRGFEGIWDTDGSAEYDKFVLGTRAQQASIHRGRWKSEEEVIKLVEPKINKSANKIIFMEAKKI